MKISKLFRSFLVPCLVLLPACSDDGASADPGETSGDSAEGSGADTNESDTVSGGVSDSADVTGGEDGDASSGATTDGDGEGSDGDVSSGDASSGDGDASSGDDGGDGDGWGGDGDSSGGDGDGDNFSEDESEASDGETGDGDGDGDGDACDLATPITLYLSPDDSNSMSSPAQVKQVLAGTGIPNIFSVNIRPWEFMNYYHFDYTPAPPGELAITAEMANAEIDGQYRMQIAVASEAMTQAQRPAMNITLVMDTSGSMTGKPIADLKETGRAIAASLKAGDIVSLLEWDTNYVFQLAGYALSGPNDAILLEKLDDLQAGGGTNLSGGLSTGYDLAAASFDPSYINRLVLISDGGANAGITDAELIGQNAALDGDDGIYLVGVGVSDSAYEDELMDTVTDMGKGASVFVHDADEAWIMFNQNFVNTMAIAARDVQVQLDMPPGFEIVKFSGEEFSADPTEIEPQHISPNDAMVFHQVIENCDPESVALDQEITITARYQDPWTFENKEVFESYSIGTLLASQSPRLFKGRAILSYAEALQFYKDDPSNKDEYFQAAITEVQYALSLLPVDPDLQEILEILQTL